MLFFTEGYTIKSYPILHQLKITLLQKSIIELILSFTENNQDFYMNQEEIASRLNTSLQTIYNNITQLKKIGYIKSENSSNFNGKNGGSSACLIVLKDNIKSDINKLNTNIETEPILNDIKPEIEEAKPIVADEEIKPQMEDITAKGSDDYDDEKQEAWFNQMAGITKSKITEPIVSEIKSDLVLTNVIEEPTPIVEDEKIVVKKLKFKEDFDKGMKYLGSNTMTPSEFHYITKDYFRNTDPITILNTIKNINKNSFDEFWDRLQILKLETIRL